MKRVLFYLLPVFFLACSAGNRVAEYHTELMPPDTGMYEMTITDPGYFSWAVTNAKPKWYLSYEYYKHFNQLYVNEWNARARTPGYREPFSFFIDYDFRLNYGIDLEYQLYWYFNYMQNKYRFKLLVTERPLN